MSLLEGTDMGEILKGSRSFKRLMNLENQLNKSIIRRQSHEFQTKNNEVLMLYM